jgi:hypothetical protein
MTTSKLSLRYRNQSSAFHKNSKTAAVNAAASGQGPSRLHIRGRHHAQVPAKTDGQAVPPDDSAGSTGVRLGLRYPLAR